MNRITPLILAVALFMEMMDSTVIATSLPAIATDIGTTPIALKLALTAYLVALAIFIPVSGWMADRYGARNIFRWAIFVFVLGSIACAFSDSLLTFVLSRFLQGMGGSMMTPLARLILVRTTPRNELISAWAWLTIPALIGPMAGPPVGGFLTTYFSWHWIFFINVPIGLIGILLASRFLPGTGFRDRRPLDTLGFVLSGLSFACVIFGLSVVSMPALPPGFGIILTIVGLALGAGYVFHARRSPTPLLDLKIFREPVFRLTILSGVIFRIGLGAVPFLLPLMLQLGFGYTPFESGAITFIGAAGSLLVKFGIGHVLHLVGFRRILIGSSVVAALFIALLGLFTAQTSVLVMLLVIFFSGYFRSLFFTSLNSLTFSETPTDDIGPANAMLAVSQQLSSALGVALAATILELSAAARGTEVATADFRIALFAIAGICAFSVAPLFYLRANAGSEVSGHRQDNAPPVT